MDLVPFVIRMVWGPLYINHIWAKENEHIVPGDGDSKEIVSGDVFSRKMFLVMFFFSNENVSGDSDSKENVSGDVFFQ